MPRCGVVGRLPLWPLWFAPGFIAYALTNGALAWDGAYYLFRILDEQTPVIFHERFPALLLTVPTWLAHRVTDDIGVLQAVFGISYTIAPLLILWCAAILGRDSDRGWLAIAFGVIFVPIQFFAVSEALLVAQLAWPLALIVRDRRGWKWLTAGVLLSAAMLFTHPTSLIVFAALSFALALRVWQKRDFDRRWLLILPIAAIVRLTIPKTEYDTNASGWEELRSQFASALTQEPVIALALGLIAGFLWLLHGNTRSALGTRSGLGAVAVIALAGVVLVYWSTTNAAWETMLGYRALVVIVSAPLLVLCVLDIRTREVALHRMVSAVGGLVLSAVLITQSLSWHNDLSDFERQLRANPTVCKTLDEMDVGPAIPSFWTNSVLSIVLQGREPETIVSSLDGCAITNAGEAISIGGSPEPEQGGWFQLPPR